MTWTDSDFAACIKSRKSTSGCVVMYGGHLVKLWSTNQTAIALSSGEAGYYSLAKGASMPLGISSICLHEGDGFDKSIEFQMRAQRSGL